MNAAADGKAQARRRFLLAGALSLSLHAIFFGLVLIHAPGEGGKDGYIMVALSETGTAPSDPSQTSGTATARRSAPSRAAPAEAGGTAISAARAAADAAAAPTDAAQGADNIENSQPGSTQGGAPGATTAGEADSTAEGAASGAIGGSASGLGGADAEALFYGRLRAAVEQRKVYPAAARLRGTEGLVRVRLHISADGRLLTASLAASSGSSLLDAAAIELVSSVFPMPNPLGRELEPVLAVKYSLTR